MHMNEANKPYICAEWDSFSDQLQVWEDAFGTEPSQEFIDDQVSLYNMGEEL